MRGSSKDVRVSALAESIKNDPQSVIVRLATKLNKHD